MSRRFNLIACCIAACCGLVEASDVSKDRPDELDRLSAAKAIPELAQRLVNALPSDAAVWQRYVSESVVYVTEAGDVAKKAELLEAFTPFPPGIRGSIEVRNPKITEFGDVAIAVFDAHEQQTIFDQRIEVDYRVSHTWRRERGRWRLLAAHSAVLPRDLPALPIDISRLRDYTGAYELSGKWRYRVEQRGDALVGGRDGGELAPLIAIGDNVFAEAGSSLGVLRIFVRGRDGTVEKMVQRRKFADLTWLRAPAVPPDPPRDQPR